MDWGEIRVAEWEEEVNGTEGGGVEGGTGKKVEGWKSTVGARLEGFDG
jgi:hypothetical protein